MPIRISTGPLGQILSLEIDSQGGTWVRGPLSVGQLVGAQHSEQVRIGSVVSPSGTGLVVSMTGTEQSTGIAVRDIGVTGSDNAGVVLSSQANGIGTGIRIGGINGSARPTLQTGIDIVGGLGLRYNALAAGVGTGIEIGGTNPPRRAIEAVASGSDHVGIVARANTNGTGIVGSSQSSSSESAIPRLRTGVMGYSASNSALAADTLVGVFGYAVRGGSGGTLTQSIGVHGKATSRSSQHAGTTVGVLGEVTTTASGQYNAIAGCFLADSVSLSIVALGGDVVLGGLPTTLPINLMTSPLGRFSTQSTTYIHNSTSSGNTTMRSMCLPPSPVVHTINGYVNVLDVTATGVQRLQVQGNGAQLGGLTCELLSGRMIYLLPINGPVYLINNDPTVEANQRFLLPNQAAYLLVPEIVHAVWYDEQEQRWRVMQ